MVIFVLSHIAPSDPARAALGLYASQESVDRYRAEHGLDRPLPVQYAIYMRNLLRGDLGVSILTGRPVVDDLKRALPATIELIVPSFVFSLLVGMTLGGFAALHVNHWPDHVSRFLAVFGMSMPVFWLGVVLQLVFFAHMRWLPSSGRLPALVMAPPGVTGLITVDALLAGQYGVFLTALKHLVLPAFTLSLVNLATLARISRSVLLEVLHLPYITVAYAKGQRESKVVIDHAVPNALIPLVTIIGIMVGQSLGGAIIVETIFAWPGIGRQVVDALIQLDVPMVTAFALLMAISYGITNLLVDVSYVILDPRIRV